MSQVPTSDDRSGLQRLARYLFRPPLARGRLEERPDGQLVLHLRKPWRDRTTAFLFTPQELVENLAALVIRPRVHRGSTWSPSGGRSTTSRRCAATTRSPRAPTPGSRTVATSSTPRASSAPRSRSGSRSAGRRGARPRSARALAAALAALRRHQPEGGPTLLALLARTRPGLAVEDTPTPESAGATRIVPSGNLRPPRDRFVGRVDELFELRSLVLDGKARLLALLGLGGIGKTRLALEVARSLQGELPGGAWAFDLTEARSEDGICGAVAAALSVPLERRDPVGQLGRILAAKGRAIVVLDNLEQCVEHLPRTLCRWLDLASEATFVGTSRVALGLVGERPVPVGALAATDAVSLFLERASRPVTPEERADVEAVCAAVEGMPLAIELAAARVDLLGVARIRSRLSLAVLAGGRRELPLRHRSLEASLDWSAELLTGAGRLGLWQLAVFEGGFTLEAAEAVLDVAGEPTGLEVLRDLVDASLLRVDQREGRFSMLVVVREYAASRSPPEVRSAAEIRHGVHHARLGTPEAVDALDAPDEAFRGPRLVRELDNLVAACRRAVARGHGSVAVATLRGAWAVLRLRGPFPFAASLAEEVVGIAGLATGDRATACDIAGSALVLVGRHGAARTYYEAALSGHRVLGDRQSEGNVLGSLGILHQEQARTEEAQAHLDAALAVHREVGNRRSEGNVLGGLGILHHDQGRTEEAREYYDAALVVHREVGNRRSEGIVLGNLGTLHQQQGRTDEAREHYYAALAVHRDVGNRRHEGIALGHLGSLHHEQGRAEEARAHHDAALAIHREMGDQWSEGIVLGNLAILHHEHGRTEEARAHYDAALAVHREVGDRRSEGIVLGNLAILHQDHGRTEEARAHYEAALTVHREVGSRWQEGVVLAGLGRLHARQGRFEEARACLRTGEGLLREVSALVQLTILVAARAEVEQLAGSVQAARSAMAEAESLAASLVAGPDSEVGRALARARAMLRTRSA